MNRFRSLFLAHTLIAALVFQAACNPSTIATVAKGEATIEAACSTASTVVIQGNQAGLIASPDAVAIEHVILDIELANGQALTATAQINTLTAANQASLLNVLQPIQTAIANAVASGTLGIKDPATKAKVDLALTTIQTAITATVGILKAAQVS